MKFALAENPDKRLIEYHIRGAHFPCDDHVQTIEYCLDIGKDIGWLNRPIETRITVMLLPDNTPCHVLGYTRNGGPKWHPNIDDSNGEDVTRSYLEMDDDETDMKTRGGVPW